MPFAHDIQSYTGAYSSIRMDLPLLRYPFTDRRQFLKTSAAATAFAFGTPSMWPSFAQPPANVLQPLPKDALATTFDPLALTPHADWRPYPKAGDQQWNAVPQSNRDVRKSPHHRRRAQTLVARSGLPSETHLDASSCKSDLQIGTKPVAGIAFPESAHSKYLNLLGGADLP
jgi:hypothetical protein